VLDAAPVSSDEDRPRPVAAAAACFDLHNTLLHLAAACTPEE
jgi:hypothetical protein